MLVSALRQHKGSAFVVIQWFAGHKGSQPYRCPFQNPGTTMESRSTVVMRAAVFWSEKAAPMGQGPTAGQERGGRGQQALTVKGLVCVMASGLQPGWAVLHTRRVWRSNVTTQPPFGLPARGWGREVLATCCASGLASSSLQA